MPMLHNPPPKIDLRCTSGLGRTSLAPRADPVVAVVDALQRFGGGADGVPNHREPALLATARARATATCLGLRTRHRRTLLGVVLNAHIVAAAVKATGAALQRLNITFESPAPLAQP